VKHKYSIPALLALTAGVFVLFFSCKKINEATELGGDLIPPVDNITTFDTTLTVQAFQDLFTLDGAGGTLPDSIRSLSTDVQYLGLINNDPLFGKTDAQMFLQLKPTFYKYTFLNRPDSLHLDSIVLVLDYVERYGDSTVPQTINVYEISQSSKFKIDSAYMIRKNDLATTGPSIGSATIDLRKLDDSVKVYKDTTAKQLRIRLSDAFGERLLKYDTATRGAYVDGYSTDSVFCSKFAGFALKSEGGGNGLMGFNLAGANTKLAIYYKDDNGAQPVNKWDTAVAYFKFATSVGSAAANLVKRDYSSTSWLATASDQIEDNMVYIQATPGTFAKVKIPGLAGINNRVIHRAELIVEQAFNNIVTDSQFYNPPAMFLDAWDPSISKYRTVPYDLSVSSAGSINYANFGIYPLSKLDPANQPVKAWHFNLTRYVQNLITAKLPLYEFRLFSPSYVVDTYGIPSLVTDTQIPIQPFSPPSIVKGRVRVHGGQNLSNPQRMRMRIIYSKI